MKHSDDTTNLVKPLPLKAEQLALVQMRFDDALQGLSRCERQYFAQLAECIGLRKRPAWLPFPPKGIVIPPDEYRSAFIHPQRLMTIERLFLRADRGEKSKVVIEAINEQAEYLFPASGEIPAHLFFEDAPLDELFARWMEGRGTSKHAPLNLTTFPGALVTIGMRNHGDVEDRITGAFFGYCCETWNRSEDMYVAEDTFVGNG